LPYWRHWGIANLVLVLQLFGCSTRPPLLPASEILARSVDRMSAQSGFEFLITRSGAPAFLNVYERIAFRRAEGQYVAPDRVSASVRVIAPGLVTDVQIISIGDDQWETNYITGDWQVSDPRYTFNPLRLFDPLNGIPAILTDELHEPLLVGLEEIPEVPGKTLYAITATVDGARPSDMTFGMIEPVPLETKIWIDPELFDVYRIFITSPGQTDEAEDAFWQIDFWNFNGSFSIGNPMQASNE